MILGDDIFSQVTRVSRYLGNEINSVHKDWDSLAVKFLLAFPDVYEIGMSHLGFQILYHLLNSQKDIGAERVFAPWIDLEKVLREKNLPLFSLESRRPINYFDIIGFSLQYELSYTNVLMMLDLGKIPLKSEDRKGNDPFIIGGGPCTFNPEPMAKFFDALVIGEGEEVILEIAEIFKEWKKAKADRQSFLDQLTTIPGIYVPSKFEIIYHPSGAIAEIKSHKPNYNKVQKRVVSDLDQAFYPSQLIVPFRAIAHDHINLEVARGCTRGCRFCQAGIIYRPVRERSISRLKELVDSLLKTTGWEEVSLLSLSTGDYTGVIELLEYLVAQYFPQNITITFPSLRAETIRLPWLNALKGGRKTGFTIAPEAGTDRLRRLINKNLTEKEILETAEQVFASGWKSIKLYFMIGLPTETQSDLEGIAELANQVFNRGKKLIKHPEVTVSVSTFIPKPHTPFQWLDMLNREEIRFRQNYLRRSLKNKWINFKWQEPEMSILEGVMARGDRRLGSVIAEAFAKGARFDGWTELFNFSLWEQAFQTEGVDPNFYLEAKNEASILPWEMIDAGVAKDFLWQEYHNAFQEKETLDCRNGSCNQCGVCDFKSIYPRFNFFESSANKPTVVWKQISEEEKVKKVRLYFRKVGEARFLSHLEMVHVFARAIRRAGIPLKYSQGFHPQPKISFGPALPVGLESQEELVDIEIKGGFSLPNIINQLNQQLPLGIEVFSGEEITLQTPSISDSLSEVAYAFRFTGSPSLSRYSPKEVKKKLDDFLSKTNWMITRQHKGQLETLNIRAVVKEIIFNHETVEFTLWGTQAFRLRPQEVIKAIFGLPEEELLTLPIKKTKTKLGKKWDQN